MDAKMQQEMQELGELIRALREGIDRQAAEIGRLQRSSDLPAPSLAGAAAPSYQHGAPLSF